MIWVINVDLDREKELLEKINRLEETMDAHNVNHRKELDGLKHQLSNHETGLGILFYGGLIVIIIFAFVLD